MNKLISPIAIDLGAKNTGVFTSTYIPGDFISNSDVKKNGYLFQMGDIQLSQAGRTVKRHQLRGNRRKKLVRRLLFLILKEKFGINEFSRSTSEFLQGLLKRRGFSYIAENINEDVLKSADLEFFEQFTQGKITKKSSLLNQLFDISQNLYDAQSILDCEIFQKNKKDIKSFLKTQEIEVNDDLLDQIDSTKSYLETIIKSDIDGHKHRRDYIKNISKDIEAKWKTIQEFSNLKMKPLDFSNLLGHLSNLQLKPLRKYFNDPQMAEGNDYWDEERLGTIIRKWLKSLRPSEEKDKEKINTLLKKIKGNETKVIGILLSTNPELSIPPYEDMNNRRIPSCQTQYLHTPALNQLYPQWKIWTEKLVKDLTDGKELIADAGFDDFRLDSELIILQKVGESNKEIQDRKQARLLQRVLDLSKKVDPYSIRSQSVETKKGLTKKEKSELAGAKDRLDKLLGKDSDAFIEMAKDYYDQVKTVRQGIELSEDLSLFHTCEEKTKKKGNNQTESIRTIIGINNISNERLETILDTVWKERLYGNTTLRSYCNSCEELRKKDGTAFIITVSSVKKKKKLNINITDDHEKKVSGLLDNLNLAVKKICEAFPEIQEISSKRMERDWEDKDYNHLPFANLFSLAQIFNILEGDTRGFSKICNQCMLENKWRGTIVRSGSNLDQGAIASRLNSDTIRQFDGVLRRMTERLAFEIAYKKKEELKDINRNSKILIPIITEMNRFEFNLDLGHYKQEARIASPMQKKGNQKNEQALERLESFEVSKKDRIKEASLNICAITGRAIGDNGQIDHIIPRSYSKKSNATIFNTEMNLIYLSTGGNVKKGAKFYSINDLHPNYLQAQFGTNEKEQVQKQITEGIESILRMKRKVFRSYRPEEQKILRHSLFVPELFPLVIPLLGEGIMAKANGTQAYLARSLQNKLKNILEKDGFKELEFSIFHMRSEEISDIRKLLGEFKSEFAKPSKDQAPGSHILDAVSVLVGSLGNPKIQTILKTDIFSEEKDDMSKEDQAKSIEACLPTQIIIHKIDSLPKYRKKNLGSKSLFKDGIFGERFVPLYFQNEKLFIGFDSQMKSGLEIKKNPEKVFESLKPYFMIHNISYKQALESSKKSTVRFPIDRNKAVRYLFESVKQNIWNDVSDILQGLRYTVSKKDIASQIVDKNSKIQNKDEILKDAQKNIKVEVSKLELTGESLKGVFEYPGIKDWDAFLKEFYKHKEIKTGEKLNLEIYDKFCREYFKISKQNKQHQKVRKIFSLPVIDNPSGGFRIKRKNYDGTEIYQVATADDGYAAGFPAIDGNVEIHNSKIGIALPGLEKVESISTLQNKNNPSDEFVFMDDWREIDVSGIENVMRLCIQPNSLPRARIYAEVDIKDFKKVCENIDSLSIYKIPQVLKLKDGIKISDNFKILKEPRGDIRAKLIDSPKGIIGIEFIIQSTDKTISELYNSGKPIGSPYETPDSN
ncbi:type II-B CRISPR-associated RNA-guided endonuclease Cas9/Csx12 [Leptospira sp. GIMC2001]|uniref:type II-B CRISPR-associated RNA-guided endonuclease Cas9/Csx12 n=1 Tax=Leptospira sp. GIMC2001 TaxID=1513297 RepID=UPI00234A0691|nr:type II-B CRISPR-associated RNA-guided endonuclease Cas9/Csx12 [Leptospira sp. GIMC2001]WCL49092.1 type II-B CRISPR-associated RNA-guided endonuclease Cas9/Csx12 [Leptospira sp. GIMC2001]